MTPNPIGVYLTKYGHGSVVLFHFVVALLCYNNIRADSRIAPSQWETPLQSNAVCHWLGANLEIALIDFYSYLLGLRHSGVEAIRIFVPVPANM